MDLSDKNFQTKGGALVKAPNSSAITKANGKSDGKVHPPQSLHPMMANLGKDYFGIDLAQLPHATQEELIKYADRAKAMEEMRAILPILEKHFMTLIHGQIEYEQFLGQVQKEIQKGARTIDKLSLDAWLLAKGYTAHVGVLGQKAKSGEQKIELEKTNTIELDELDLSTYIQLANRRQQQRSKEINAKEGDTQKRDDLAAKKREETKQLRNLLLNGSTANNN